MWFKNTIFYRFTEPQTFSESQLTDALQTQIFSPCRSQELSSYGWVPPHPALDDLLFNTSGVFLVCAQREEKILPATVIKRQLDERVTTLEREQARKIYRKEKLQLKDEIILDLLPRAFSRFQTTCALLIPGANLILIDSANHKRAEELLNLLRNSLGSLPVALPDVHISPATVMSQWLEQKSLPEGFRALDTCELQDGRDEGGTIRIKGEALDADEVIAHIETGKQVVKLALNWEDHLNFTLQQDLALKQIKATDTLTEAMNEEAAEDPLTRLDADLSRLVLEYQRLIPALLKAFGGEIARKTV